MSIGLLQSHLLTKRQQAFDLLLKVIGAETQAKRPTACDSEDDESVNLGFFGGFSPAEKVHEGI